MKKAHALDRPNTDDRSAAMTGARPPYFANRVLRLAIKTALAQHSGVDAFALLCVIAMTEDARRYRGPVTFWNAQLLPLVGFAKWERLERARQSLIDAGWLVYEPGGRHRAGRYRVAIPPGLEDVTDTAVDDRSTPVEGYQEGYRAGVERGIKPESSGVSTGVSTGGTFLPVPDPSPIPSPCPENKGAAAAAGDAQTAKVVKVKDAEKAQEPIPIPVELDTEAFRHVWEQFLSMRKEISKPLKPIGAKAALSKLQRWGETKAIEALENATAGQWLGLFEPNAPNNGQRPAFDHADPRGNFAAGDRFLKMMGER